MTDTDTNTQQPGYKGGWIQEFLVALVFLTRLPMQLNFSFDISALKSACRAFPLIGLIVGGLSGTVFLLSVIAGFPEVIAALLAIGAQILITGALHEDAIGDIADGFGGGTNREKKLEIMKDSRVGTYAVVILVLIVLLKAASLTSFPDPVTVFSVLVVCAATSRGMMGWGLFLMQPAREDGLGKQSGKPELITVLWLTILSVVIAVLVLGPYVGAVALLAGMVGAAITGLVAQRQVGGQTGDVLGGIQQVSELFSILACLLVLA
ncbi:MAG: adenosylcobinamide-GDP ribazoletransferase [Proteobacteria bacterium]|nr:adenosylcobinamide-GDP ribazoletransferase [Pseudomonadota bacterium]